MSKETQKDKVKVLICGGGNGAHVFAGLSSLHFETAVLDLYDTEAEKWSQAMESSGFVIEEHKPNGDIVKIKANKFRVSKKPEEVAPGSDIVIITVPAFAHEQYFEAIKGHVKDGVYVVGVPGQAGFEFDAKGILKDTAYNLFNFETLPWACRIKEYGSNVEVLGIKDAITGVSHCPNEVKDHVGDALEVLQTMMGDHPKLKVNNKGHPLAMTLMGLNAYVHTSIMYAKWKDWDGTPVKEPPLFYHGIDEYGAHVMSSLSDEVLAIVKHINKVRPEIDLDSVEHIWTWYIKCYGDQMDDKSTLCTSIKTNHAYNGLKHPMVKTDDGGYVPNFRYRYFTEDVPTGLVVLKGVALIAGVKTPYMDEVIYWAQKQMGKEYLVDGKLNGKDLGETRAPQKYGLNTLDDILIID